MSVVTVGYCDEPDCQRCRALDAEAEQGCINCYGDVHDFDCPVWPKLHAEFQGEHDTMTREYEDDRCTDEYCPECYPENQPEYDDYEDGSEEYEQDAVERAERGFAYMDENVPGWRENIDPLTFNIHSSLNCVFGQHFGTFQFGQDNLGLSDDEVVDLGFDDWTYNDSNALQRAWLGIFARENIGQSV